MKNISLKQVRASKTYLFSKNEQLKVANQTLQNETDVVKLSLNEKRNENQELLEEILYLRDLLNDNHVNLYNNDCNSYTAETQECVYTLLNHNVTTSKVSPVIEAVLKLVNLKAKKLPTTTTRNNMNIQRLILEQKQLSETLITNSNMCLLSDETSKYGQKIEGFHVSDDEGRLYVLGLRQLVTKSGQDTFMTLQDILTDINQVSTNAVNPVAKQILLNILSTMSDRAATQQKLTLC